MSFNSHSFVSTLSSRRVATQTFVQQRWGNLFIWEGALLWKLQGKHLVYLVGRGLLQIPKKVDLFVYLGFEINDICQEVNIRISVAIRCHSGLAKHFKIKFISHHTKTVLYMTLVRLVVTYSSEAVRKRWWKMEKKGELNALPPLQWYRARDIY